MAQLKDLLVNGSARVIGSLFANLSGNVLNFGVCSTAAATAAKTVTTNGTFELITGSKILVLFSETDTSNAPTLNVNGTGAKNIKINASDGIGKGFLAAQLYYWFIYDGTNWRTTGAGITLIIPTQYGGTGNSSYTANRVIYSNTATKLASSSITTDGAYLGAVSYLTINEAHLTSYRFLVNGASYFKDNITIKGNILPLADSTYNIGSTAMHWANGYFDYLYISTDTGFTSQTSGKAGVFIIGNENSAIELVGSTPYIDFHQNNSTADFTSRIISDANGRIHILSSGTVADLSYFSRTIKPNLYNQGAFYASDQIETANYFLNNRNSAGGGYHVYGNNVEYGRWWISTIGVAGTATTYTNPDDSSQTVTGYTGNVAGKVYLSIGNNKAVGSNGSSYSKPGSLGNANNAQGYLRLFSSGTDYSDTTTYRSRLYPTNGIAIPTNRIGIMFRPESSSYYTHFAYETSGNEALVMATQKAVTSFIFVNGESYANVAYDRWTKLTGASGAGPAPGILIKQNCVSIGELWPHNTNADYKLRVNGTSLLKGNTTVGTTTGGSLGIALTDGAGRGISLYNGPTSAMPDYGIAFAKTATFGTHGAVTSDWATYFTMSDTTTRGWIFRRGSTNVASIDGTGKLYLGYAASTANPGIYWNPYVESASDGSDVSAIYQIKSGVAGGTELRISQANDATDVINIVSPQFIYLNSKKAFKINDTWLRINEDRGFSDGIYTGSSVVRTDNQFQVGDNGALFYATSSGNGYFSNTLGIAGTNTSYKLYVNGTSYFNNNATFNGHVLPNTTNTYDLGSSSLGWRKLYLSDIIYNYPGASISGKGNFWYCTIITINTNAQYINNPIVLEVSGRGIPFTLLLIHFLNSNNVDPGLLHFTTNCSNRFYIKKTDTNQWTVYCQYTEMWGSLYVHRITGNGASRATISLANIESLPADCILVSSDFVINGNLIKKLTIQANGTQKGLFNNSADVTVNLGNVAQDFTGANSGNAANINADTFAGMTRQLWLNTVYPIGSIYMSVSATSPAMLFGGKWEQLKDCFLLSAGSTYTAGSTGGEAQHTLTVNEMPTHSHTLKRQQWFSADAVYHADTGSIYNWRSGEGKDGTTSYSYRGNTENSGDGNPHNNMPPYLTVYMWKRTA